MHGLGFPNIHILSHVIYYIHLLTVIITFYNALCNIKDQKWISLIWIFFTISDWKIYDFMFEEMKKNHKNIEFISCFNDS